MNILLARSSLLVLAAFFAAGVGSTRAADYSLSINTVLTQQDPLYKGLEQFKANVESRTQGKVKIRLFPASKLGKDEDLLEQASLGANVAVVVDGGRLSLAVKEFGILGAPYLAQGYEGMRKIVTSPLFEQWNDRLRQDAGYQILSFNWWQGERHLLTNKPVRSPADLAGIRMRTPGAPVWMETVRAMGATPTPMAWPDVYAAMQQQVIDGVEAQHTASYGARLHEVAKVVTKTGHINLITGLVTSAIWFDKLPPDYQAILREEALKGGDTASRATGAVLAKIEEQMRDKGQRIDEIDVAPFREATGAVYTTLGYADLRKRIEQIVKE